MSPSNQFAPGLIPSNHHRGETPFAVERPHLPAEGVIALRKPCHGGNRIFQEFITGNRVSWCTPLATVSMGNRQSGRGSPGRGVARSPPPVARVSLKPRSLETPPPSCGRTTASARPFHRGRAISGDTLGYSARGQELPGSLLA